MPTWLRVLNQQFPIRYWALMLAATGALLSGMTWAGFGQGMWICLACAALVVLGLRDLRQTQKAIRRNYPIVGRLRYLLEFIRPEIRQYFIESDAEAAPFSRAQRSLVYQRAKGESDKRPFGSQVDMHVEGYEWINHSMVPTHLASSDFRVTVGAGRERPYALSVFNISAMSFGSLSANAILSLNKGARMGNFAHDTGEGSISRHHRVHEGDLVWEIGSGYFGCRDENGQFDEARFVANATLNQVKMIELKLSQGAKPGHGGMLPGAKVTAEIAEARGVPEGKDCISPAAHSAFDTPIEMLEFIERLRQLSGGKPVGFKFCVGHPWEWFAICKAMLHTGILPDFIVVDGAEGGTGAAPVEFADHVGTPLQEGLLLVSNTLVGLNLRDKIRIGCSGKIVSAFDIARAMALGADWCNSARGFMFALGCIQAQSCHTGHCPTGVTTQDPHRQQALVVTDKAERVRRFHANTLDALRELVQAAGLTHPREIHADHIVRRMSHHEVRLLSTLVQRVRPGCLLDGELPSSVFKTYWPMAQAASFAPCQPASAD